MTAPLSPAWITPEEILTRIANRDDLGTKASDGVYKDLAESVCNGIESDCAVRIMRQTYTRRFLGSGREELRLPYCGKDSPIVSVGELKISGSVVTVGTADEWEAGQASAYFSPSGSIYYPPRFPLDQCQHRIKVTWTAGWQVASAVPKHLHDLAIALAILAYRERSRWGKQSTSIIGSTVTETRDLPPRERKYYDDLMQYGAAYLDAGIE